LYFNNTLAVIGKDIKQAARLLAQGQTVAIPTETVYGLAANALDEQAVLQIFKIKNRPHFDPLIVHLANISEIEKYTLNFPEPLQRLAHLYMPGPLTVLLPKKNIIPDLVTSGLDRVAIRIPKHPFTLRLLSSIDFPLAAPSANPFGYISPTTAAHVAKQLGSQIPYILDGGAAEVGIESTIVGIENEAITVYRLGGLSIDDIERQVGKVHLQINRSSNPKAPGQIKSHYAPKKPFYLGNIEELIAQHPNKKIGVLYFAPTAPPPPKQPPHPPKGGFPEFRVPPFGGQGGCVFYLSENKDTYEAAVNLFNFMRKLDDSDVDIIIADYLPEIGLGKAINDRLRRAAE
jgi:L-threonylcarbamoyladenylate synthase